MKHKEVGSIFENYCTKCEKETKQLVVIPHFTDSDNHECSVCGTINYSGKAYEFIWELRDSFDEISVVEWNPQGTVKMMANLCIDRLMPDLEDDKVDYFCDKMADAYISQNLGAPELAAQFADEVLFEVCLQLHALKKAVH